MSIPDDTERMAAVDTAGHTASSVSTGRPGKPATSRGSRRLTVRQRELTLWVASAAIAGWVALAHHTAPTEPLWCAAWGIGLMYAARRSGGRRERTSS